MYSIYNYAVILDGFFIPSFIQAVCEKCEQTDTVYWEYAYFQLSKHS